MCFYDWIYVWTIMNMHAWNSSIDECLNAWVVFLIYDEIVIEISIELLLIMMKIGVVTCWWLWNMIQC